MSQWPADKESRHFLNQLHHSRLIASPCLHVSDTLLVGATKCYSKPAPSRHKRKAPTCSLISKKPSGKQSRHLEKSFWVPSVTKQRSTVLWEVPNVALNWLCLGANQELCHVCWCLNGQLTRNQCIQKTTRTILRSKHYPTLMFWGWGIQCYSRLTPSRQKWKAPDLICFLMPQWSCGRQSRHLGKFLPPSRDLVQLKKACPNRIFRRGIQCYSKTDSL